MKRCVNCQLLPADQLRGDTPSGHIFTFSVCSACQADVDRALATEYLLRAIGQGRVPHPPIGSRVRR